MSILRPPISRLLAAASLGLLSACAAQPGRMAEAPRRNVIIFVADGLRAGSVTLDDAPNQYALRRQGVWFANSHSLFPTFTTANAATIASGHQPGDTGDFSNTLFTGFPVFDGTRAAAAFGKTPGTVTPFLENNQILADIDEHFAGASFIDDTSLLAAARAAGYRTAAIGKVGPVGIQDLGELKAGDDGFATPDTVVIDDNTGRPDPAGRAQSPPLPADIAAAMDAAGLPRVAPPRTQPAGSLGTPGTLDANAGQQDWFVAAATRAVIPVFRDAGRGFVMVFWSRDPDGTQHNQGDSLNRLEPGINGPTSRKAVANADADLGRLLDAISRDPRLAGNTDVFVTSDHGFATISKHETSAEGGVADSWSTTFTYRGNDGKPEVQPGWLPPGFLALDLAHLLDLPLWDPDTPAGASAYRAVDPSGRIAGALQRPASGNGVIGGSGERSRVASEARVVVAANGGSDLVYLPDGDPATVRRIVAFLLRQPYAGALFVHSRFGAVPGTLPLSSIGLEGSARFPTPDLVVAFRDFPLHPGNALQTSIQISDTGLQEGQGMHGGFSRACTLNSMAAIGPDFRAGLVDRYPVSNADIAPTIAHILHLQLAGQGKLAGRVIGEALSTAVPVPQAPEFRSEASVDPASGRATVLEGQYFGGDYFDRACLREVAAGQDPRTLRCP